MRGRRIEVLHSCIPETPCLPPLMTFLHVVYSEKKLLLTANIAISVARTLALYLYSCFAMFICLFNPRL